MSEMYINVSTANLYREAAFRSEMISQALLWEAVDVLEHAEDFIKIRCTDGYEGWVSRHQLSENKEAAQLNFKTVTKASACLYDSKGEIISDVTAGCNVPFISKEEDRIHSIMPDGADCWIPEKTMNLLPPFSRENMMAYAGKYRGVPYYWGGKSPKGFDCSGFTQHVHAMFGINLRRDAYMQFEDGKLVSEDPLAGQPGDMMFFAENGDRITHVGFCLGDGYVIHARGYVRINSLDGKDAGYNEQLRETFVAVKSFL